MKLILKRDQKADTGVFGGNKGMIFQLTYRVELDSEERELIKKYKVGDHGLTFITDKNGLKLPHTTVNKLVNGFTDTAKDISILFNNEETVKEACKEFRILLDVMKTFGGEQVIDY